MDVSESWIAVSFTNGQIALFKVGEMIEVGRLVGHEGMIADLHFCGKDRLTSAGEDGTLRVWFPDTGIRVDFEKRTPELEPGEWIESEDAGGKQSGFHSQPIFYRNEKKGEK